MLEGADHPLGRFRLIRRSPNLSCNHARTGHVLCGVAPSCWNHVFSTAWLLLLMKPVRNVLSMIRYPSDVTFMTLPSMFWNQNVPITPWSWMPSMRCTSEQKVFFRFTGFWFKILKLSNFQTYGSILFMFPNWMSPWLNFIRWKFHRNWWKIDWVLAL